MSLSATSYVYFAACSPGLGDMLVEELRGLGLKKPKAVPGGVEGRAPLEGIWRANLGSALALRVWFRIAQYEAAHFDQLLQGASKAPWRAYLSPGSGVKVVAHCAKSRLIHSAAVAERIEGVLRDAGMEVREEHAIRVQVRIFRDKVSLSVDSSGLPLPKRGWRPRTGKAPLSEDLARAGLLLAGWRPGQPLLDPMCGAGTIALEAATWASGRPAGWHRRFAFEDAPHFDAEAYAAVRKAMCTEPVPTRILARDRDAGAIAAARENAAKAGLAEQVEIEHASVAETRAEAAELGLRRPVIVTNPPYGQRTGREDTLVGLYRALGQLAQRWPGATLAAWSSRGDLLRAVEPRLERELSTDHGGTRVHFAVGRVLERGAER